MIICWKYHGNITNHMVICMESVIIWSIKYWLVKNGIPSSWIMIIPNIHIYIYVYIYMYIYIYTYIYICTSKGSITPQNNQPTRVLNSASFEAHFRTKPCQVP